MTLKSRIDILSSAVATHRRVWWTIALGYPVFYYGLMMALLLGRFQALPNYFVAYDWLGNVLQIIKSTPSISDMYSIIAEEWLFEVGRMNYDYGNGISEWSLNIVPAKLLIVVISGVCLATIAAIISQRKTRCSRRIVSTAGVTGGLGAFLVGATSITLSWVVCCATPNWVVGLAILGVSVSTSLWLEQFGPWLENLGFLLLLLPLYLLTAENNVSSTPREFNPRSETISGAKQ